MIPRRTGVALAGLLLAALALALPARAHLAPPAALVRAARRWPTPTRAATGAGTCAARLAQRLDVAEAWAWSLCWDEGARCTLTLAWQRQRAAVRGWLTCAVLAAGP